MSSNELVQNLQAWHESHNKAPRRNRNVLQYAAGVAALLGIGAGSGGVFALATAVTTQANKGSSIDSVLTLIILGSLVLAAILLFLLVVSFFGRLGAEAESDRRLKRLIELKPDHFLPQPE